MRANGLKISGTKNMLLARAARLVPTTNTTHSTPRFGDKTNTKSTVNPAATGGSGPGSPGFPGSPAAKRHKAGPPVIPPPSATTSTPFPGPIATTTTTTTTTTTNDYAWAKGTGLAHDIPTEDGPPPSATGGFYSPSRLRPPPLPASVPQFKVLTTNPKPYSPITL